MYQFSEDAIREAAYYIWKNNGCKQGTSLSDWDAAINQLSAQAAFSLKLAKKSNTNLKNTKKNSCKTAASQKTAANKTSSLHNVKSIVLSPLTALKSVNNNRSSAKKTK